MGIAKGWMLITALVGVTSGSQSTRSDQHPLAACIYQQVTSQPGVFPSRRVLSQLELTYAQGLCLDVLPQWASENRKSLQQMLLSAFINYLHTGEKDDLLRFHFRHLSLATWHRLGSKSSETFTRALVSHLSDFKDNYGLSGRYLLAVLHQITPTFQTDHRPHYLHQGYNEGNCQIWMAPPVSLESWLEVLVHEISHCNQRNLQRRQSTSWTTADALEGLIFEEWRARYVARMITQGDSSAEAIAATFWEEGRTHQIVRQNGLSNAQKRSILESLQHLEAGAYLMVTEAELLSRPLHLTPDSNHLGR